jgi:hypothetical protein
MGTDNAERQLAVPAAAFVEGLDYLAPGVALASH